MQFLRKAALVIAMAGVSIGAQCAFAQQEVDPDHYDQPVARAATKAPAKAATHKSAAVRHPQGKANAANHHSKVRNPQPTA
jgi:hypothetical protein